MPDSLTPDEARVLAKFRKAVTLRHADIELSVKRGRLMKIWLTEKENLEDQIGATRHLKEV
jgi:hypothetical protein